MSKTPLAAMAALRLELRACQAVEFTRSPTLSLHAALHRAVERVDADISARLHAEADKSFTLSPLFYRADRGRRVRLVRAGERVQAHLDALNRDTLDILLASLTRQWREARPLDLDWTPFTIEAIVPFSPIGPGYPLLVPYGQLWAMADPAAEIRLRFASPVAFRNKGESIELTDPWRIVHSYLRRWRAFADVPLPEVDEPSVRAGVVLELLEKPEARPLSLGLGTQSGYFGAVRLNVTGDEAFRRSLSALADYATYCGTGGRTAFGMGQTERVR